MQLQHGIHLGYCTNIHRGESWEETWQALKQHTLRVKAEVAPDQPYGIGLRLSARAAAELAQSGQLLAFQRWLEQSGCYVFTINGFPYGSFHGTRVKEQVFLPDWSSPQRLEYTNLLFDLLAQLLDGGFALDPRLNDAQLEKAGWLNRSLFDGFAALQQAKQPEQQAA